MESLAVLEVRRRAATRAGRGAARAFVDARVHGGQHLICGVNRVKDGHAMSAGVARAVSVRFALQSTAFKDARPVLQASLARAAIRRRRAQIEAAVYETARPADSKRRRKRDA